MVDLSTLSDSEREVLIAQARDAAVRLLDPDRIILFGSAARGRPAPGSDLDILIIKRTDEPFARRAVHLRLALMHLNVPMDLLVYTPQEFDKYRELPGSFADVVLREGRVLYERQAG